MTFVRTVALVTLLVGCGVKSGAALVGPTSNESSISTGASDQSGTELSLEMSVEAAAITQKFYEEYLTCMADPPGMEAGNVGGHCQSHNSFATTLLPANLEIGGISAAGADPITCAQSFPISFRVVAVPFDDSTQAESNVIEKFSMGEITIKVKLTNSPGELRVDNIICPAP